MGAGKRLEALRMIRPPRQGALVAVCEKCERRLEETGQGSRLREIVEGVEREAKSAEEQGPVRVVRVGCLKVCPEDGVTVCALRAGEYGMPQPIVVHSAEEAGVFFGVEITGELVPGRS